MPKHLGPEESKIRYPLRPFLREVFSAWRPYRGKFVIATLVRLVGDLAWLYPAYGLAVAINFLTNYAPGQSLQPVWMVIVWWALAVVIRTLSQFFCRFIGFQASERVMLNSVYRGISHLFLLDMAWHERENSGNKLKRIQSGSNAFDTLSKVWFNSLIEVGVNFVGGIFIISRFDTTIAVYMLLFLVIYFTASFVMARRAALAAYYVGIEDEKVHGLLSEAVGNIRTVKVMGMGSSLKKYISAAMEQLMARIRTRLFRFHIRNLSLSFLGWGYKLGILVFIILGILKGRYELGFLVLFNSYFNDIWQSVSELANASQDIAIARYNIGRMGETLAEPVTIDREEGKQVFPKDWKVISIKNLSFSYGKNNVLSNISFDIRRGQRIGIVGLSGAGKSTLFKLLLKEYESDKGDILIDGVSLRDISKIDYFKYVSVVLQDTEVFNFSLKDNITLVNPEKGDDERLITRAMKIAHVSNFVRKLPDGVHTLIGERGIKLSGGERQRLGIARAVFKEPQILLLDEATSHLDLESEEKIRDSLHDFFQQVTAVVIAHRLTTIREMDTIIVFENGKILEQGNFDTLHKKKGRFYELWEKQKL